MNALRAFLFLITTTLFIGGTGLGQSPDPPKESPDLPSPPAFQDKDQPDPPRHHPGMGPERLEKYKKMRLIEVLDLKEEEAVRFMAKYNTHENTVRDLMKERMDIVDQLEEALKAKGGDKDFQKLFGQLDENEQKMFNERRRFHNEIKSSLTTEQAAKFLVFDRNFNRELRGAMEDMRRERHERLMR